MLSIMSFSLLSPSPKSFQECPNTPLTKVSLHAQTEGVEFCFICDFLPSLPPRHLEICTYKDKGSVTRHCPNYQGSCARIIACTHSNRKAHAILISSFIVWWLSSTHKDKREEEDWVGGCFWWRNSRGYLPNHSLSRLASFFLSPPPSHL